jgi:hypothetical protein
MRASILFTVAATAVLVASLEARADPRRAAPIQLTYTRTAAASACPDAGSLRSAVLKEMGYDPFDPSAERKLEVSIDRRAGKYVVTMEMRDEAGQVVWNDDLKSRESCRTLVDAAGLAIVITIDPPQDPEPCPVCPAPVPSPPPAPPSPPPAPPAIEVLKAPPPILAPPPPPAPDAPPKPVVFRLGAAFWLDYATVPRIAPGIALSGGVRHDWWSATLEARWDPPASQPFPYSQVDTARLTAGGVLCGHHAWFAHCLVAEVGDMQVGANAPRFQSLSRWYTTLGTRVTAELAVQPRRLFLQVGVDVLASIVPYNLAVDAVLSSQIPRFSAGGSVGLLYTIEKP